MNLMAKTCTSPEAAQQRSPLAAAFKWPFASNVYFCLVNDILPIKNVFYYVGWLMKFSSIGVAKSKSGASEHRAISLPTLVAAGDIYVGKDWNISGTGIYSCKARLYS